MEVLTSQELRTMIQNAEGPCISIYMPTHRTGVETREDPTRLKDLMRQADERLADSGLSSRETDALLKPLEETVEDAGFWMHAEDGLALLVSPEQFHAFRVPMSFDERLVIANRFHIKPLLPLITGDGEFYVLAISQNRVRLLRCTRFSVHEVPLKDTQTSLAESLRYDDRERQLQFHTLGKSGRGRGHAEFHGHGGGVNDHDADLVRFAHQIDSGVMEALNNSGALPILAGAEPLVSAYREVSKCRHIAKEGLKGNMDSASATDLQARAWPIFAAHLQYVRQSKVERYRELRGTGLTSNQVSDIVPFSYYGRIQTLFVALDEEDWGVFDDRTMQIGLDAQYAWQHQDLLDLAASYTFINGGEVYGVPLSEVPDDARAAAILRY